MDDRALFSFEARRTAALDVPHLGLPCCYDHTGSGCAHDATHWVLGGHGRWPVVDTLDDDVRLSPPPFCKPHADLVCERRNAPARPAPPAGRQRKGRP